MKISFSTKVLLGAILGLATGLIFGPRVAWFSILGDVFIGLLQMTVLPYIMFSLIVNIGRLSVEMGRKIIKYGIIFLGMLLGIGLLGLAIFPLAFPEWSTGSFYSVDLITPAEPFDFVSLYIPSNPFESLSNNVVPAVVLFSIFVGLGLMHLPNKEKLLEPLDVLTDGLNQVNKLVVKITPYGVFSIAAGVLSEMSWQDLSRLQGYILIYALIAALLLFVVLPFVISSLTPYSARDVFGKTRSTLITIFATGKIIVVYPQLIEDIKSILKTHQGSSDAETETDIVMPLAYPFPNLGTFMIFIFVPFAAWFTGNALDFSDYPVFLSSTLLSSFVAPITGLPFSLELLEIPAETFQLFVVSTVITDRIRVVVGALHLITLTILVVSASGGLLKFKPKRFVSGMTLALVLTAAGIFSLNQMLSANLKTIPTNFERINRFGLVNAEKEFVVETNAGPNPTKKYRGENTLGRIKRRGIMRVGYYKDTMPFAFVNGFGELTGYGIDLAHLLASDLKVSLEFVPVEPGKLEEQLENDYFDIVMSDVFSSSEYAERIETSKPYLDVTLSLLVARENSNFDSFQATQEVDSFTVAYFVRHEIATEFASHFAHAGTYGVSEIEEFFDHPDSVQLDAYLTNTERAAVLTMQHPEYKLVNPLPYYISNSLVFPIPFDDVWKGYIDKWIDVRKQDGSFERVYDQWILGKEFREPQPQWNVLDDVIIGRATVN